MLFHALRFPQPCPYTRIRDVPWDGGVSAPPVCGMRLRRVVVDDIEGCGLHCVNDALPRGDSVWRCGHTFALTMPNASCRSLLAVQDARSRT